MTLIHSENCFDCGATAEVTPLWHDEILQENQYFPTEPADWHSPVLSAVS